VSGRREGMVGDREEALANGLTRGVAISLEVAWRMWARSSPSINLEVRSLRRQAAAPYQVLEVCVRT
jgi:hypothetical protein